MTTVYHYLPSTGEFTGSSVADQSPLEDDVWLIPANATVLPPPMAARNEVACFMDGNWQLRPDWRGALLWDTASGAPIRVDTIGVVPTDIAATSVPRPSAAHVWRDGDWSVDAGLQRQQLVDLVASRLAAVNAGAAQALAQLTADYPAGEVQSWAQQTREAEAIAAEPHAAVPLLSAIAAARGLSVTELASRVRAKVEAYAVASGAIIGQRQALEDAIAAVDLAAPDAAAQLEAVAWPQNALS